LDLLRQRSHQVVNGVVLGLFEEEEEGMDASDVVKAMGEGCAGRGIKFDVKRVLILESFPHNSQFLEFD